MRKLKESPSEKERRLRHHPSARMSQDQKGYTENNSVPDARTGTEKFRSRGLNEDEQLKSANYVEDNAQSRKSSPNNETNATTSSSGERGQVEDTNDARLEADEDQDDIN